MAALAGAAAVAVALAGARVMHPPGYFTKYLDAARADEELRPERAADYSFMYVRIARTLVPRWGARGLLALNVAAHGVTAAAVATAATVAVGWGWGLGAGLAVATYRPFLVYAAVLEPEAMLLALLAGAVVTGMLSRRGGGAGSLWGAGVAGFLLALAGLTRPVWLAALPLWAVWVARGEGGRWEWRRGAMVLAGAALVLAPALGVRLRAGLGWVVMNPGTVLYEGNGPQATGAPGVQPELVKMLESRRGQGGDWAHAAYRQVAEASLGRQVTIADSNRFWAALVVEHVRAEPLLAGVRLLAKSAYALASCEFHDLPEAEELDRRLRGALPWGFGVVLALAIAGLPGARRAGGDWVGPVALAVLSFGVQVVFYASARQRLPLALAALVMIPLGLGRCGGVGRRLVVGFALGGVAVMAAMVWLSAPLSSFRHSQLSTLLGPAPAAKAADWLDGRAWRPTAAMAGERAVLALELQDVVDFSSLQSYLAPALATDIPWLRARALLALAVGRAAAGAPEVAAELACRAAAEAPGLLQARALCAAGGAQGRVGDGMAWRPAGVDPISAHFALARALAMMGRSGEARRVVAPVLASFPELAAELPP